MFEDIKYKLQTNPEVFSSPVQAMLSGYKKLRGNNSLVSAMSMFGRYCGINLAKRGTTTKRKAAGLVPTSGPSIGVQPTAIARRRVKLGGRRRMTRGRPTKEAAIVEHGYARGSQSQSGLPKRVRVAAPHSLSHATTMCQSLGKTHSAK